jgi:hypothetical protein
LSVARISSSVFAVLCHEARIEDDHDIGLIDPGPDFDGLFGNPIVRHDGRAAAFRAECRKALGIFPLLDRRQGQQFHGGHRPLPPSSMPPYFNHVYFLPVYWIALSVIKKALLKTASHIRNQIVCQQQFFKRKKVFFGRGYSLSVNGFSA